MHKGRIVLFAVLLLALPASADVLPTHGMGPHLDPFITGWLPPTAVGPAANGTTGELVLPFTASTPWSPAFTSPAYDNINTGEPDWHWEAEFDFIGLSGVIPVSFFGAAPVPVIFGPGIDIYIDIHQQDLGGSPVLPFSWMWGASAAWGACGVGFGETGSVCKQLVNHTLAPIAWGTSVTETGEIIAGANKIVELLHNEETLYFWESNPNHNTLRFSMDPTSGGFALDEMDIPEPASVAMAGLGLCALGIWRRRRKL